MRQETPSLLQFDKKTDAKVVEAKKKSYLQQNSSTFSQLVAEAKARRSSNKSAEADLETCGGGAGAGPSPKNIEEPGEDALEKTEDRLQGVTGGVKSGASGVKRGAGDLSISSSAVSSEKRPRSGGRDEAMSTSSKETHSSYFTTATHVSSAVDTKNQNPLRTPVKNSDAGGGVGELYVTPTKSFIHDLAKSPKLKNVNIMDALKSPKLKNGNIVDVLNRSSSQAKMVAKATCPVCNAEVKEKFLNIHLDKCLR